MTKGRGWFETPGPDGVAVEHQKAANKRKSAGISNAEVKPKSDVCADEVLNKIEEWNPNEETVEDLMELINELDSCPDFDDNDYYELDSRLSVADGYQEFADDYSELPLWTVDYEGYALTGEDAGTIIPVNEIDDEYFAIHGFSAEEVVEIQKTVDAKFLEDEPFDEARGKIYQFDDNTQWIIFKIVNEAKSQAVEYVKGMLEDEPELFTQSWLENFMVITDTDKRMLADEDATNYAYEQLTGIEAMEKAGFDEKYNELQEDIDLLESEIEDLEEEKADLESIAEDGTVGTDLDTINKIDALESEITSKMDKIHLNGKKQEALPDEAREKVQEDKYDEIYEELNDPIQYFVRDQGLYSREDLIKASFISIDESEAAQDAVESDGVSHFLAGYDGNEVELDNGIVMYRVN